MTRSTVTERLDALKPSGDGTLPKATTEAVERAAVALAIANNAIYRDVDWRFLSPANQERYRRHASAAVEAAMPAHADLVRALTSASHALRSYQFGNSATDLAESTADACDAALARSKAQGGE